MKLNTYTQGLNGWLYLRVVKMRIHIEGIELFTTQWWQYRLSWHFTLSLQTRLSKVQKKKRKRKWGQTSPPEVEMLIGFCKQACTCSQSRTYTNLSNASAALRKPFFLQVSQQGLILSTSNSDASCDESLMWENWKTIIWTWQISLAGQSSHSSC